jgi:iron complex transport system substrate-binding protein
MKKNAFMKIISLILISVLILAMTGCSTSGSSSAASSSSSKASSSASEESAVSSSSSSAAASSSSSSSSSASGTHTITDHAGNTVEVPNTINRIVVCDIYPLPSVLSVFFDSAEKIVGMAPQSMSAATNSLLSELYPEILNANTDFIDGTNVNIEELLKLKPDIVFYGANNTDLYTQLKNAGLCAVGISANKWQYNAIETLDNWIKTISEIFPDNDKTSVVEDYSKKMYDLVQGRVSSLTDDQKKKVFFLFQYSDSSIKTSGKQFFGEWWAEAIGAKNVAEELTKDNSVEVNMEQIISWNPSLIFITNFNKAQPEDLYNNTTGNYDWSSIDAVKNKEVYKMPLGMYRSYTPGVDTPITLIWLAKTCYPDLFSDIDITTETKSYYKQVFGIDLTDDQANKIFAPVSAAGSGF